HPYAVAKLVASFGHLYGRRIYLNMVAGGFKNDLVALNDTTPHDRRYDRLIEYTRIIRDLLASSLPVSHEGEYYTVKNLKLTPPLAPELFPGIFVSGSSDAGLAAAKAIGAVAVKDPEARGQARASARRAGALHRGGVSVVHPRHSPHGGGIAAHEPGLPPRGDPGDSMTSLLQQWVTEQAERRPDATAVVMHGARLTYEELDASSNRLARTLKATGCEQGDRVGLMLAKSPL